MDDQGKLYRALDPIYAREPLSGRGAEINGDRFKPKGTAALYLATSFQTAIREAKQVGDLQPTTIVSYEANIEGILDGRDPAKLEKFGMSLSGLSDPTWRDQMKASRNAHTRIFTETLMSCELNGVLVPIFAWCAPDSDISCLDVGRRAALENHSHRRRGAVRLIEPVRPSRHERQVADEFSANGRIQFLIQCRPL